LLLAAFGSVAAGAFLLRRRHLAASCGAGSPRHRWHDVGAGIAFTVTLILAAAGLVYA
jgi:hypothetical protein